MSKYTNNKEDNQGVTLEKLQNIDVENHKKLNPNSFPFWVFPKDIQNIITDAVDCLNYPIDYLSSSILFACGLANGLATKIEIKKEWSETTAIWLVIVGEAGANKSHPLSFALKPIQKKDNDNFGNFKKQLEAFNSDTENTTKPVLKKVITSDVTVEALSVVHRNNIRGIGIYADELKGWLTNMNRYNNGSDVEFFLKTWSNKSVLVDRKGSDSNNIPEAFISVIGTIQNEVLIDVTGGKNSSNGFSDRLLYVIPKKLRKLYWNDKEISNRTIENYNNIIGRIINQNIDEDENMNIKPLVLKYTPEALEIAKKWQIMNTDRYNSITNKKMNGIYSKMETYINRFALILQLMSDACDMVNINKVDVSAIKGAIEITEYFITQAKQVKDANTKQEIFFKDKIKERFYNDLPANFKTSQAKEIGKEKPFNLGERYIERFLADKQIFTKVKHGVYSKVIL